MTEPDRRTVLVIFPGAMMPIRGGGTLRTWSLIDGLRHAGLRVELVTTGLRTEEDEAEVERRVDRLWVQQRVAKRRAETPADAIQSAPRRKKTPSAVRAALKNALAAVVGLEPETGPASTPTPNVFESSRRRGLEELAQRAAFASRPFAAIATYAWVAPALDRMPPGVLRILDTIDVQHTRRDTAESAGGDLSHVVCTREEEIRELSRADVLLAIQREEFAELKTMCPDREVLLVEHSYTIGEFVPSDAKSAEVLYVGNLYDPNVIGLKWYFDSVWPKVRERAPETRMTVCGRICEAFARPIPGVTFEGVVPDLRGYYRRAALAVNPVTYGTGLKIKSIEAMAHGRCLVCSESGTQGLDDPSELPVVVATDAKAMADAVVRLLHDADARASLERRAYEYTQRRYGPDAVYGDLLATLSRHAGGQTSPARQAWTH